MLNSFVEYPEELHDEHSDYPLAPERLIVTSDMLSCKQKEMYMKISDNPDASPGDSLPKLIPNLQGKTNYITHSENLKLYTSLGMVITKIHRGITFTQKAWLAKYIDFNTQQRANASNEFEKNFYKLLNNSVFGKTMENVRNHRKIDLVTNQATLKKLVSKPTFKQYYTFHENLVAVERIVSTINLNRPMHTGFCVLELSKTLMYRWHYHYVKAMYPGEKSKLLFTNTDSLVYQIKTSDLYTDMQQSSHLFDFSGYDHSHKCYSPVNKKVIGKMKDELNGSIMSEFIGLRSKMYSIKDGNQQEMKKAKGVRKNVIKNEIKHNDYKNVLLESSKMHHINKGIRSQNHQLFSIKQNKVSLSAYDDKRYILDDGISTYAYGHYKISNNFS